MMTSCKSGFDELEKRDHTRASFQTHPPNCCNTMMTVSIIRKTQRTFKNKLEVKVFIEPSLFYKRFTLREMLCCFVLNKSSMKKSFDLGVTLEERKKIKFLLHYTFCKTTLYLIKFNLFLSSTATASTNITFKKHFSNIDKPESKSQVQAQIQIEKGKRNSDSGLYLKS